jgi:Rps23 Pro-64 3,4-dihydroxylase Tpa1-like proline 4-hydroxylase
MKQIETNSELFFKFENVLDKSFCKTLKDYVFTKIKLDNELTNEKLPWVEEKTITWKNIDNEKIKQDILKYKFYLTQLIYNNYKKFLYPIYTDLVVWQKGKKMEIHQDNSNNRDLLLKKRIISTVTYLNEDFEGGETIIYKNDKDFFINKPKTGSVLIFTSDEKCKHSVNEIISGERITMPIWFTDDIYFMEKY